MHLWLTFPTVTRSTLPHPRGKQNGPLRTQEQREIPQSLLSLDCKVALPSIPSQQKLPNLLSIVLSVFKLLKSLFQQGLPSEVWKGIATLISHAFALDRQTGTLPVKLIWRVSVPCIGTLIFCVAVV